MAHYGAQPPDEAATIEAKFSAELGEFSLNIELSLPATGVTVLFGHSGCGKTTLLRCIAGLHQARGQLNVAGEAWQRDGYFMPVHQRPLAYVFQEASLFPHLNVRRNLEYGFRRIPPAARQIQFDQAVQWLGLEHLLLRRPDKLSGGERQRVAIARALLTSPRLLLMDEPLSALDHNSKQEILPYLEHLHETLAIPVLYVTHSPDEVARLADHLVVLERGRAVASGELSEILARIDLPIPMGEEAGVVVSARIVERDPRWHLCRAEFDGGGLWLPDDGVDVGGSVRLRVLARDVSLALDKHEDQSMLNLIPARVIAMAENERPGVVMVKLKAQSTHFLARLTARSVDKLHLIPGKKVWLQVKSVAVLE